MKLFEQVQRGVLHLLSIKRKRLWGNGGKVDVSFATGYEDVDALLSRNNYLRIISSLQWIWIKGMKAVHS